MTTIGLTYDSQDDYLAQGFSKEEAAKFDQPQTISAIEKALVNNGYIVERVGNLQSLVNYLAQGKRWNIVFNICEGVKGIAREAQVPALLEAYNIPFVFSDAETMIITMDKALAKRLVSEVGIPTAPFVVIKKLEDINIINLSFPLFAKPIAKGTGKDNRDSYIESKEELIDQCEGILVKYHQAVLIEEYLPGRDLTVGIVGSGDRARVIGVMESVYNKEHWESALSYEIANDKVAKQAAEIALKSWILLGCKDGGCIELRCNENNIPCFLKANPLASLQPGYSDYPMLAEKMGIDYDSLIGRIIEEACIRYKFSDRGEKKRVGTSAQRKKRVVILFSGEENIDREDNLDTLVQLKEITRGCEQLNYEVFSMPFKGSTRMIELTLKQYKPDVVFNLVESVNRSDRLQYTATALLDRMDIPYTGATTPAIAMLSSKTHMKTILQQSGIPTPDFYFNKDEPKLANYITEDHWIVKSDTEHASMGLDSGSVVKCLDDAIQWVNKKEQLHGGDWFIEKYIDGREFNFAMLGRVGNQPQFLLPTEIVFNEHLVGVAKISDYKSKWEKESLNYTASQRRTDFNSEDQTLLDQMREICLKCWKIFRLSGAVRIDFRSDAKGQPWVVDINVNPCLSSDAGFMAAVIKKGMTLQDVIKELFQWETCNITS